MDIRSRVAKLAQMAAAIPCPACGRSAADTDLAAQQRAADDWSRLSAGAERAVLRLVGPYTSRCPTCGRFRCDFTAASDEELRALGMLLAPALSDLRPLLAGPPAALILEGL